MTWAAAVTAAIGLIASTPALAVPQKTAGQTGLQAASAGAAGGYDARAERAGTTTMVRNASEQLEVFVADGSGKVWHRWQNAPGSTTPLWSGWSELPGREMYKLAAETNDDGRIELVGLDSSGQAWHRWQLTAGGSWSGWSSLGGTGFRSAAVALNKDGHLDVFAVDSGGRVNIRSQTGPGHTFPAWTPNWIPWDSKAGFQQVAAETNDDGRVEIFLTDASGLVWHRWQLTAGGNWSDWSSFDGAGFYSIAASRNKNGRIDLYATNSVGQVNIKWQLDRGSTLPNWSPGWANIGGDTVSSFAVDANDDGRLEIVAITQSGDAQHIWQTTAGATWSKWDTNGLPGNISWTVRIADGQVDRYNCEQNSGPESACVATFIEAISTPYTVVRLGGHLDLDLSGKESLPIAEGVQLIGDRTANPEGPQIHTDTFPRVLFFVGTDAGDTLRADGVHISGVRLRGGSPDDPFASVGPDDSDAVNIQSSRDVEIDHSEFSHWKGAAVSIIDGQHRIDRNSGYLRVHDNYFHDNQHPEYDSANPIGSSGHGGGYGVATTHGAYALVERNVFARNRHAITAGGDAESGYWAKDNLVLAPGIGQRRSNFVTYNHSFDVHGTNDCGLIGSYNCGPAGEHFEIRSNAFVNENGLAIKLRGTPTDEINPPQGLPRVGMLIDNNSFRPAFYGSAYEQTETGIHTGTNLYDSLRSYAQRRTPGCDFDHDGVNDTIMTTGVTWWYASSARNANWTFLAESSKSVTDIQISELKSLGGTC
ncbi:hypothetical protein ABT272_42975 [Streptomyces sp900105245]|uniref:PLL-like beta propeller domain-containing protein n=1 Tax=Streptomyces sp. 900105245 TaxID=3154379 RepID=A0ABV1UMD5_9ACTN